MNPKIPPIALGILLSLLFLTGCDSISLNSFRQSNCPQLNVSITQIKGMLPFMEVREYDGWKIAPYDTNTMIGFNFGKIYCHNGNKQGQNPNFLYCGDQSSQTTMAFIQKKLMNKDGTIGETVRQSFVNVYERKIDENLKFLCDNNDARTMQKVGIDSNGKQVVEILECGKDEYLYVFQKTICGEDPDKIAEREFKQQMNEIDNMFG